ncbi:MAG: DMT family transporter [Planctomycetes bacterium]|nr:DMT family transporter [Planctomycetota bacterium]
MPFKGRFSTGTLWMMAAAASFVVMAASAKALPRLPTLEKVFFRSLISIALTLWAMKSVKQLPRPKRWGLLTLRAVLGFAGLACYFEAIARMPLGTAVTIYNVNPVFAGIFGVLFLGEAFRLRQGLTVAIGLVGVALVKGFNPSVTWDGVAFAMGTAIFSAAAYSSVRKLTESEHSLTIVIAFPLIALPLSALFGGSSFLMPSDFEWLWLLLLGVSTQVGQVCLTHGLRHHTASRAMQISYLGVIFAMGLGVLMGDAAPGAWEMIGALLIVGSVAFGKVNSSKTSSTSARG